MNRSILLSVTLCLCIAMQALTQNQLCAQTGNTALLTIDAQKQGHVISPLLFGHNLEHTRRAIWQGIGAEMIANRKFAAADCGLPMRWTTLTGKGVAIDDKTAYTGKHSVRLEGGCGIWQQQDWLTFEKWRDIVQESAEFMASFAVFDTTAQHYVAGRYASKDCRKRCNNNHTM